MAAPAGSSPRATPVISPTASTTIPAELRLPGTEPPLENSTEIRSRLSLPGERPTVKARGEPIPRMPAGAGPAAALVYPYREGTSSDQRVSPTARECPRIDPLSAAAARELG